MRSILPDLKSVARSSYLSYQVAPAVWRSWKYLYASATPVVSATHLPVSSMSCPPKADHHPNEWYEECASKPALIEPSFTPASSSSVVVGAVATFDLS